MAQRYMSKGQSAVPKRAYLQKKDVNDCSRTTQLQDTSELKTQTSDQEVVGCR